MRRWWGRREIDSYKDNLIVRSQYSFDGGPCWSNMMAWLKAFYRDGKQLAPKEPIGDSRENHNLVLACARLFRVTEALLETGVPWKDAKKVIRLAARLIEGCNPTWDCPDDPIIALT